MTRKALFLDRDGVINVDSGYVHKSEDIEFVQGIFDIARLATESGYLLIVVTNQSGIGRGLFSETDFWNLMGWMENRFAAENCPLTAICFVRTIRFMVSGNTAKSRRSENLILA